MLNLVCQSCASFMNDVMFSKHSGHILTYFKLILWYSWTRKIPRKCSIMCTANKITIYSFNQQQNNTKKLCLLSFCVYICLHIYKDIIINVWNVWNVLKVLDMCVRGDYGIFLFTVNICMHAREMKSTNNVWKLLRGYYIITQCTENMHSEKLANWIKGFGWDSTSADKFARVFTDFLFTFSYTHCANMVKLLIFYSYLYFINNSRIFGRI